MKKFKVRIGNVRVTDEGGSSTTYAPAMEKLTLEQIDTLAREEIARMFSGIPPTWN